MPEYLQVACPQCQNALNVREEYIGRRASCKRCEHVFVIQRPHFSSSNDQAGLSRLLGELDVLKAELLIAESGRDAAHAELDRLKSESADASRKADEELRRQQSSFETVETHHRETLARLEADLQGLGTAHQSLLEERDAQLETLSSLQDERESARASHHAELAARLAFEEKFATLSRDTADQHAQIQSLEDAQRAAVECHQVDKQSWDETQQAASIRADRALADVREELRQALGEVESLKSQLQEALERHEHAEAELTAVANTSEDFDQVVQESRSLEAALKISEERRADAESGVHSREAQIAELKILIRQGEVFRQEMKTMMGDMGIKLPF